MAACPFCDERIPSDFLAGLLAAQQAQWDEQHGASKTDPRCMIGRK